MIQERRKRSIPDGASVNLEGGHADGYDSDTEQGCRTRRAFLVAEGENGLARRLAFGECRMEDGTFVLGPDGVLEEGRDVDVAGMELGSFSTGGLLSIQDLYVAQLDFWWMDDDDFQSIDEAADVPMMEEEGSMGTTADHDIAMAADDDAVLMDTAAGLEPEDAVVRESDETRMWRERACELEDEAQYLRDCLAQAQGMAYADMVMTMDGAAQARCRVELSDPDGPHRSKLVPLEDVLREHARKREACPIMAPMKRLRQAQMAVGAYKARYGNLTAALKDELQEQLAAKEDELQKALAAKDKAHSAALEQLEQRHREQLRKRDEQHAFAIRLQQRSLNGSAVARLQRAADTHKRELATRAKRAATWTRKRSNITHALNRATAARDRAQELADTLASDLSASIAENTALSAVLGNSIQVAEQRQNVARNGAFTFQVIHRDLQVRQKSLNSGAGNIRDVTKVFSENIAADGRSLGLESGSVDTVLRWEKRADVLCMLHEGRALRNAIRATPETRLWFFMDLSPDCRAIEQFGAGFEYATVVYLRTHSEDVPQVFTGVRLIGAPLSSNALVHFGPDGCPIITETCHRTFTPMLEALGPKYTSTIDCFLRTLQLYGLTPPQLQDDDFAFATVEQANIPIPLLDHIEGFVSDAGGEVHKSGGVISVVLPRAMWRHCGDHGLNLSMEKSAAYSAIGSSIRSISSFCRNGNKHTMLVHHMKRIQQPELAGEDCDERIQTIYRDAHEQVFAHCPSHTKLGDCAPRELEGAIDRLQLVVDSMLERKYEKGNDTRWKYEAETVDKKLLDTAHLLAPAILIMYGAGKKYAELKIDEEKNKTASSTYEILMDPEFLFWATHMRIIYTSVYKGAFDAVQFNHHRNAPALAGPDGLPIQWAAALRKGVTQAQRANSKPALSQSEPICAPLIELLNRHKSLGGIKGECASAAAVDLLAQADHITSYFARWNTLEGLVHVLAREEIVRGPLPRASCARLEDWDAPLADAMPRVPAAAALEAAKAGIRQFAALSEDEQHELPGSLPWLLFSPTTRDGEANPVFDQVQAFAAGSVNPATGRPCPYRCWPGLTRVLVAGGAKYTPTTSAQCESYFNGLTRQQGASKLHMSQQQISFEARCKKNPTMGLLTPSMLSNGWEEAKAVQTVLDTQGFWSCDVTLAVNRQFAKKQNEQVEIEAGSHDGEPQPETYDVEHIVRAERKVAGQERTYVVKWVGWPAETNTIEPESHLLECKALLAYWKSKKNSAELARVTKLQEAALKEHEEASRRRAKPLEPGIEVAPIATAARTARGTAASTKRPVDVPAPCKASYDRAHSCLGEACCLVFDTETSGFGGCVLNLGWVLASADGAELATYDRLWRLPKGERIHSKAFAAHGISSARLRQSDVVEPKPELAEFFALVAAALASGVRVVAHNASFDVHHLNHTARIQKLPSSLSSASMLCTMHSATKHCGLRKRGNKALKAPRNEELYTFLFKRKPTGRLHSALPDCRVTLASFIEGRDRQWW